jgi:hypothetical protein
MKVSRFLPALLFVAACGGDARDDRSAVPQPAVPQQVVEPALAPEATTGEQPVAPRLSHRSQAPPFETSARPHAVR